jgi:glycerophosphoryl diester phosphodiesterase
VPRAFLLEARGDWLGRGLSWSSVLLEFDLLHVDQRLATARFTEQCRARGIPFSVWTVNDEERARELLEQGATSVITDALRPWPGLAEGASSRAP